MQIKKSHMTKMGDATPLRDIPVLVLLKGVAPPRFARYSRDGYSVQGIIGITKIDNSDLWLDISDLLDS